MTTYQDLINEERGALLTRAGKARIGRRFLTAERQQNKDLADAAMLIVASTPERKSPTAQSVLVPCDLINQLIGCLEALDYDPKKFRTEVAESRMYFVRQAQQAYRARQSEKNLTSS